MSSLNMRSTEHVVFFYSSDWQKKFTCVFYFYPKEISIFHSENNETLSKKEKKAREAEEVISVYAFPY